MFGLCVSCSSSGELVPKESTSATGVAFLEGEESEAEGRNLLGDVSGRASSAPRLEYL